MTPKHEEAIALFQDTVEDMIRAAAAGLGEATVDCDDDAIDIYYQAIRHLDELNRSIVVIPDTVDKPLLRVVPADKNTNEGGA